MVNLETGEDKGKHDGLMYYTIGQRQGLGIGGDGGPYFVAGKNLETNELYVVQGNSSDKLNSTSLLASEVNFINPVKDTFEATAKFRYRQKDIPVTVKVLGDDKIEVSYDSASAVTPGQAVVLYDGDTVIGGATIDSVYRDGEFLEYLA